MRNSVKVVEPELVSMKFAQEYLGGKGRQWFYDRLRSDPSFPRPVRSNPHRIEFRFSELKAWVESLPRVEFDGASAIERRQMASRQGACDGSRI